MKAAAFAALRKMPCRRGFQGATTWLHHTTADASGRPAQKLVGRLGLGICCSGESPGAIQPNAAAKTAAVAAAPANTVRTSPVVVVISGCLSEPEAATFTHIPISVRG